MCALAGGMRTAIEALLLGSRVTLVEMRKRFTRHNLLHVRPFLFATPLRFDQMANEPFRCATGVDELYSRPP